MSNSTVQILARVLRVLLIFALLLNVLALLLVPASVMVNAENLFGGAGTFLHDLFHPEADDVTLQIREKVGGTVTVLTMGPPQAYPRFFSPGSGYGARAPTP